MIRSRQQLARLPATEVSYSTIIHRLLRLRHHCRHHRLAGSTCWRMTAGSVPRRNPSRQAHAAPAERDRRRTRNRRGPAAGKGDGRAGQHREEPSTSSASATNCARRSTPSSAMRRLLERRRRASPHLNSRDPRHQAQRRPPIRADRGAARHLQDRSGPSCRSIRTRSTSRTSSTRSSRCSLFRRRRRDCSSSTSALRQPAALRTHRREAAAPDPRQPALQRDQVHRCRHGPLRRRI
jgi:hypothetical protein